MHVFCLCLCLCQAKERRAEQSRAMKFNKQFSAYVQTQQSLQPGLSHVHFKRLKKLLKLCTSTSSTSSASDPLLQDSHQCLPSCAGPSLSLSLLPDE